MKNHLRIKVNKRVFQHTPAVIPLEIDPFDPEIKVKVTWGSNPHEWAKITVNNFHAANGYVFTAGEAEIDVGDHRSHTIPFVYSAGDPPVQDPFGGTIVKYDICYHPVSGGDPYVVDPGVILKP